MTSYFIISVFIIVIAFDVWLKLRDKKTITEVMRSWYQSFIFVPFTVGVLFLGHFLDYIHICDDRPLMTILGLTSCGLTFLIISIFFSINKIIIPKWLVPIIILLGYFFGDVFF
jgi:hypothetical protein